VFDNLFLSNFDNQVNFKLILMKKLIFLFFLLITSFTFSQNINELGNGYTEVVKTDNVNAEKIYNKLKEWISLNYKSANDVIKIDSKSKIILKGDFVFKANNNDTVIDYKVINTLMFSIKEDEYIIDLVPTGIYPVQNPSKRIFGKNLKRYVSDKPINKADYSEYKLKIDKTKYNNSGFSLKKTQKMNAEHLKDLNINMDNYYLNYINYYNKFNTEIKKIFTSIKLTVAKKEEW